MNPAEQYAAAEATYAATRLALSAAQFGTDAEFSAASRANRQARDALAAIHSPPERQPGDRAMNASRPRPDDIVALDDSIAAFDRQIAAPSPDLTRYRKDAAT